MTRLFASYYDMFSWSHWESYIFLKGNGRAVDMGQSRGVVKNWAEGRLYSVYIAIEDKKEKKSLQTKK